MESIDESLLPPTPPRPDEHPRWDGVDMQSMQGTKYGDFLTRKVAKVFPALGKQ